MRRDMTWGGRIPSTVHLLPLDITSCVLAALTVSPPFAPAFAALQLREIDTHRIASRRRAPAAPCGSESGDKREREASFDTTDTDAPDMLARYYYRMRSLTIECVLELRFSGLLRL